ncbi:MAG: hypothetical protein WDO73_01365 [Ignavibacteriota bacterium]
MNPRAACPDLVRRTSVCENGTDVSSDDDVQIILDRQGDGVRQRELELAVVNQAAETRRILQHRQRNPLLLVGAPEIRKDGGGVTVDGEETLRTGRRGLGIGHVLHHLCCGERRRGQ